MGSLDPGSNPGSPTTIENGATDVAECSFPHLKPLKKGIGTISCHFSNTYAKIDSYTSSNLLVVITLSMGSNKKKPMTKKEREEKRRNHKEKRSKK